MQKQIVFVLIHFLLLSGCASNELSLRHDVALSSDSERIAYDVVGRGKTSLIFIHGWSCDGRYWQKQIPVFAKEYQVITVDLAGHGHSSLDRSEFSMLSFANDVKAIIDKENEETGHFPMLEKPEEFNMLLKKALDSIESQSNKNI